jgi:SAM-dependent methyltransferase
MDQKNGPRRPSLVPTNIPPYYLEGTLPPISELLADAADPVASVRESISASFLVQSACLSAISDDDIKRQITADTSRIPLSRDREGYGGEDHVGYWAMGFGDALHNNELIKRYLNKDAGAPITTLDLGCSSGRVLRHQHLRRPGSRTMGSDINPNSIAFARSYLPPEIIAFHNVSFPPLPLPDASVDFITAFSVFTHIDEFEDAWLLEVSRVLRSGGVAFVTVHTERTFANLRKGHWLRELVSRDHSVSGKGVFFPEVTDAVFEPEVLIDRLVFTRLDWPVNNTNVFHRLDYIKSRWSQFFSIEEIVERAHGDHQDGIVLRK